DPEPARPPALVPQRGDRRRDLYAPLGQRAGRRHPVRAGMNAALTLRAGAAEFSYLEAGDGPPLVLLHGIGGGARSFRHQLDGLSGNLRVIAWDAPGYGGSTALAAAAPDSGDYAAALLRLIDALALDRCH